MYTQAIGQDSGHVLALFRDEIMINDKEMGIRVLKQREGVLGKAIINWDFEHMNFKSIYSEKEGDPELVSTVDGNYVDEDSSEGAILGID